MLTKLVQGYSFQQVKVFSPEQLKQMALDCGDTNFIHHDTDRAKQTRFGEIIASGSAISALFSAMIPAHISPISPLLGLEMSFKFSAPIRANIEINMKWEISNTQPKQDSSTIITLVGEITDAHNNVLVQGEAKITLLKHL